MFYNLGTVTILFFITTVQIHQCVGKLSLPLIMDIPTHSSNNIQNNELYDNEANGSIPIIENIDVKANLTNQEGMFLF